MTIMTNSRERSPKRRNVRRVSTADAKAKLSELIGAVAFGNDTIVIERRGRPLAALVSLDDAQRIASDREPKRPQGALALLGAWAELDDDVIDDVVADIYESRVRDTGRPVPL